MSASWDHDYFQHVQSWYLLVMVVGSGSVSDVLMIASHLRLSMLLACDLSHGCGLQAAIFTRPRQTRRRQIGRAHV